MSRLEVFELSNPKIAAIPRPNHFHTTSLPSTRHGGVDPATILAQLVQLELPTVRLVVSASRVLRLLLWS